MMLSRAYERHSLHFRFSIRVINVTPIQSLHQWRRFRADFVHLFLSLFLFHTLSFCSKFRCCFQLKLSCAIENLTIRTASFHRTLPLCFFCLCRTEECLPVWIDTCHHAGLLCAYQCSLKPIFVPVQIPSFILGMVAVSFFPTDDGYMTFLADVSVASCAYWVHIHCGIELC